jgi:hypothetical protein
MTEVFLVLLILLVLVAIGVAFSYGSVKAYIAFSWIIPFAGIYWWNYEVDILNAEFIITLVWVSFLLSIICLPLLLIIYWKTLSGQQIMWMIISAFFHSIPFLMYSLLSIFPPR